MTARAGAWALLRWAPVLAWAALIYLGSEQPTLPQAPLPLLDVVLKKSGHAIEYAMLALLLYRALGANVAGPPGARMGLAWALAVLYAIFDELHQARVPGRTPAALDVAIDAVGAALGLALWHVSMRLWARRAAAPKSGVGAAVGQ